MYFIDSIQPKLSPLKHIVNEETIPAHRDTCDFVLVLRSSLFAIKRDEFIQL